MDFYWEKEIIQAGYKQVLKDQHPDKYKPEAKAHQEEVCKRLAVARNRLINWLNAHDQPEPVPIPAGPSPRPIIDQQGIETLIEFASDLFLGRRPRAKRTRRPAHK